MIWKGGDLESLSSVEGAKLTFFWSGLNFKLTKYITHNNSDNFSGNYLNHQLVDNRLPYSSVIFTQLTTIRRNQIP